MSTAAHAQIPTRRRPSARPGTGSSLVGAAVLAAAGLVVGPTDVPAARAPEPSTAIAFASVPSTPPPAAPGARVLRPAAATSAAALLPTQTRANVAPVVAGFGYPVRPFHREHPVRGFFGDPRTVFDGPPTRATLMHGDGQFSFHEGVDISAKDGTAVYAVRSGVVQAAAKTSDWFIDVDTGPGQGFTYWHVIPAVRPGQRVVAYETVLGHVRRGARHVHLTVTEGGRVVNPLAPGRLGPYRDTTPPRVRSVELRSAGAEPVMPEFVQGRVEIVADVADTPTTPAPGLWRDMPTTPAVLAWRVETMDGRRVRPKRTVIDVRERRPDHAAFWRVFARGTHQNMSVFGPHFSYRQPGRSLYRLTPDGFDTRTLPDAVYEVVVVASDVRGNRDEVRRRFTVHNRPVTSAGAEHER